MPVYVCRSVTHIVIHSVYSESGISFSCIIIGRAIKKIPCDGLYSIVAISYRAGPKDGEIVYGIGD